ncbi:MAG: hypothetical protein A2Y75_05410 [Candidatus Solincola sediminis]|uniref:Uncharacterized protein n=1 Tax=Candidatus Solincola sediminis TaxID=1797199 RepID=A0A1F2WG73_9ACTN|nr:MAG: hypothetical protein A2Y75_05410 [Candidatus Solincola sediminis]
MSALSDTENVWLELTVESDARTNISGMSEDDAYTFLSRGGTVVASTTPAVVAAIQEQDYSASGMIALIPSADDIERLVITGGEQYEDIHLTLFFLGDVTAYPPTMIAQIAANIETITMNQMSLEATGFGASIWNPESDSPCTVLNVGGECLTKVHHEVSEALADVWGLCLPKQHCPWAAHIALAYTSDVPIFVQALERVGPITFDRIRVAFGESVIDLPLYGGNSFVAAANDGGVALPYHVAASGKCGADEPYAVLKDDTNEVMGCHGKREDANAQIAALYASEIDGAATEQLSTSGIDRTWNGVLVVEDVPTGDGRQFAGRSLVWAQPPLSLLWQKQTSDGHMGSVVVGQIQQVWRDEASPTIIRAQGTFDDTPEGDEAMNLVSTLSARGVSVDVDDVGPSDVEYVFPQDTGDGEGVDNEDDADMLAMMFGEPPELMIFHKGRIRAATLVAIPAFVEAQIEMGPGMPPPSGPKTMPVPTESPDASGTGEDDESMSSLTAGLSAGQKPPREWFSDPQLSGPTALTITDGGRIFGHAALFGSCHVGVTDKCTTPPFENAHDYFLLGETVTASGETVAVGNVTLGTGHAATFGLTAMQALEHYDNTGTCVADVACGNDQFGIWVAGSLRPGLSDKQTAELRAAKLSGDWRRIGGQLRLIAMLAVNVPGFPVPRMQTRVADGRQLSLVASGIMQQSDTHVGVGLTTARARLSRAMAAQRTTFTARRREQLRGVMRNV